MQHDENKNREAFRIKRGGTIRKIPVSAPSGMTTYSASATKDEVLECAINEMLDIAVESGLSREDAEAVLFRMVSKLTDKYRGLLKL